MDLLQLLLFVLKWGIILYSIYFVAMRTVLAASKECQTCGRRFKHVKGRVRVTCSHCKTNWIIHENKTLIKG